MEGVVGAQGGIEQGPPSVRGATEDGAANERVIEGDQP